MRVPIPRGGPMAESAIGRRTFLGAAGAATAAAVLAPASRADAVTPAGGRGRQRRVRFGVNYVPTENWWFSWSDWNRRSIDADLKDIATLGMDHIRIMLLWSELQPNSTYLRGEQLDRLAELLDLADARDLDVEVTVLNGAVSGVLFVPPYLISNSNGRIRNVLTDPIAIDREQWVLGQVAARIGNHRRFLGFDLSNEIHWFAIPLDPPGPGHGRHDDGEPHVGRLDRRDPELRLALDGVHALLRVLHRGHQGFPHRPATAGVDRGDRCLDGLDGRCRHPDLDRAVDPHD